MEKTDILLVALSIVVIIFTIYIGYLKAQIGSIMHILDFHDEMIHKEVKVAKIVRDVMLNQTKFNDDVITILNNLFNSTSPTGGRRSEAEA